MWYSSLKKQEYLPGEILACGDEYGGCHFIVLRLGQEVRCDIFRISGLIRQNKNFGRTCYGVNAHISVDRFLLCLRDISDILLVFLRSLIGIISSPR